MKNRKWDIVELFDSVVVRDSSPETPDIAERKRWSNSVKGALATSLGVVTLMGVSVAAGAAPTPIIQTYTYAATTMSVVVPVKPPASRKSRAPSKRSIDADTQIGMSTNRLAALGPILFDQVKEEVEDETGHNFF